MKRRMITAMIFSTLLAVSLTGCGTDDSSSTAAATTGTAASTESSTSTEDKQTDTTAEIKTTTAETTASETPTAETTAVSSVLSDEQMKEASMELIQKYVNIYDGIFCGCVEYDENDCISPDSMRYYYRVTDPKYQSISDLKAELGTTLSGTEYDNMVSLMFEQEPQIYLEQEGKLYALSVGRGSAYSDTWCWNELQFTNVTDTSFTVTAKYIHISDTEFTQSFDIVMTQDGFRICGATETVLYPQTAVSSSTRIM